MIEGESDKPWLNLRVGFPAHSPFESGYPLTSLVEEIVKLLSSSDGLDDLWKWRKSLLPRSHFSIPQKFMDSSSSIVHLTGMEIESGESIASS